MSKVKPTDDSSPLSFAPFQSVKKTDSFLVETTTFDFGDETFFATYWRPQQFEKPKGLIFFCHGYAEYFCPSYDEIAEKLCSEGFLVFGHDHVGHGRTTGQRVQVNSMDDYVQPILSHVKKAIKDFNSEIPAFIMGHSMGGLITVYANLSEPTLFKGIVFMAPLITMDPNIATPFKRRLAGWFKQILPSFSLGELDHAAITRDEEVVNRVKDDPLGWHGGFRTLHSYVLLQATDTLADGEKLKKINVPVIIFQGGQDRLVCPDGAIHLHEHIGSTDKKLSTYPDAYHNLFVELDVVKMPVIKETCQWLLEHL